MFTLFADSRLKSLFGKVNDAKRELDSSISRYSARSENLLGEITSLEDQISKLSAKKESKVVSRKVASSMVVDGTSKRAALIVLLDEFEDRLSKVLGE